MREIDAFRSRQVCEKSGLGERYKIEAKNSELKNRHSYHVAVSKGLENMQLQGAVSMFVVNLKRILKLV
jgi:hypothetical protein